MDDDAEFYIPYEKDLTGTVFSDPAFFRFFPVLNHVTVMRYFELSPFYEQSYNLNARTSLAFTSHILVLLLWYTL